MNEIQTIELTDEAFDNALAKFALVKDELVLLTETKKKPDKDELMDRYNFTSLCEAMNSQEFEDDAVQTAQDLELAQSFDDETDAWQAIQDFYAARACVLLQVGDGEEFIVGEEIAKRFGWL